MNIWEIVFVLVVAVRGCLVIAALVEGVVTSRKNSEPAGIFILAALTTEVFITGAAILFLALRT